jgi:Protein of unknown function (DUF3237)
MFDYDLEHIFSYTATLDAPEVVGPVPEGIRANFYWPGGEVSGPKLQGKLRPVGGDWFTVRTDGVGILDVRATLELNEGVLVYIAFMGVGDLGAEGYERFLRGDLPPTVALRVAPRLRTAHPDFVWLNRLQCLGIGEFNAENSRLGFDVYAVH